MSRLFTRASAGYGANFDAITSTTISRRRDLFSRFMVGNELPNAEETTEIISFLRSYPELRQMLSANPGLMQVINDAQEDEEDANSQFVPAVAPEVVATEAPQVPLVEDTAKAVANDLMVEAQQQLADAIFTENNFVPPTAPSIPGGSVWQDISRPFISRSYTADIQVGNPRPYPTKKTTRKSTDEYVMINLESSDLKILEQTGKAMQLTSDDFEDQAKNFKLCRLKEKTMVFGIVTDLTEEANNRPQAIPCYNGVALGGYVHDASRDSYLVRCTAAFALGSIPFGIVLTMPNIGNWKIRVPIAASVLEKTLNEVQLRRLKEHQQRYPENKYRIEFVQMSGCH